MPLNLNPNFDEHRWVINIRRALEEELDEDDNESSACIFNVPKTLMCSDPESYTPHQVAIGPYHHWRPELFEMGRCKLVAAKRTQKQLQCLKFQDLVQQLIKLEPKIRACYHKFLDFSGETLTWMMAIDASFLLDFLQIYVIREGKTLSRHNAILRDIVMLENQIPFFILKKMLEFQFQSLESADDVLLSMLMGLYKEISPFKMMQDLPKIELSDCPHLLDFLYHMFVPKSEGPTEIIDVEDHCEADEQGMERFFWGSNFVKQLLKNLLLSRPVKAIVKLPWTMLSNLPGFSILKHLVTFFCFSNNIEENKSENESSKISKPPLVEEITIPSVSELSKAGVRFSPTNGNISTISFDVDCVTFYLPTISLDLNTEVILRNLVAYEASNASGPLVFTRYTELMNGIIDTEDDVKLLRERGIILNRLKSDEEAARLWNGMSKSIRLTKVPFLDEVIEDINKYYDGRWLVKIRKFMKHHVFSSWQFLTLLAAILLLFLMMLQAFCALYGCSRSFRIRRTQRLS
ncbi:hypothetical protein Pint_30231 [Pistacia integerrima]|uniref:Uncharacterized protein n=1 Tax=Pistacia integerrima TaxID=434235 RepID=A0ACC0X155_9ROSI|nr:hypothetical protein Pint_30231 [Pistacia integerrima]